MSIQITNVTQGLTTSAQMRATTQMLMQPYANWETYLTPAPLSIAIMMELVFISSVTDFSINKNPPADGFKHIRYPESFRACLMQVCNSGWQAFNTAGKNMDQIRLHTARVPGYMRTAVTILFSGNDEVIEGLLPVQLQNLDQIATDCTTLAESVEQKYVDVILLIQELLEACISAEHFYGEQLEKVRNKIEENKLREQAARELNEISKKAMETMTVQMKEANEMYKQSMDSLPTGWQMIGMDFVEGLASIVNIFTMIPRMIERKLGQQNAAQEQKVTSEEIESELVSCTKSAQIVSLASSFRNFIENDNINWAELYDQKTKSAKTTWTKDQFRRISLELEKVAQSTLKENALALCGAGISICETLDNYAPDQPWDENITTTVIQNWKKLYDNAQQFDTKSKKVTGSPALTPKPPMMYKSESSSDQKASQMASENAKFKIVQSREQLKDARESYQIAVQNMEKNQKELTEILIELQSNKIKEIDFNTTINLLGKGMDAMGRVKVQWEKMVQFFQMMSTIVKTSLGTTLSDFSKEARSTSKLSYSGKLFAKDMIYNQAFQASNFANLVHMISGTYCEVSNKYLMDRVSRLGTLMVMDKNSDEFLLERQNLQESCKEAQEGILQLVRARKQEFESMLDTRLAEIESNLRAVLPASSPEETKRIEGIVQAGLAEDDASNYA